ncbi:MAG TPA: hypothetical protein DHU33_01545 [Firmicutes bacterium]|nr:hypothetical protein [Bacillota bacterium]
MKDKKIIILSIVGVLLLVSIVVATSYAYFVANVSGNKDANNVVVTNGVMSLEYSDGDEITLANAVPGNSVTKTFTVKNTGNVSTNYTIYFSELSNKFVDKTDLVYTLTSSDGGKSVAQTQVPSTNEAMVSNYAIEAGKTHTYTLTITFLNKDENQDDNQGVSFSTKVSINETKEYVEPPLDINVELAQGMIPVKFDDVGNVVVADTSTKWYDYEAHEWANAVLVNCADSAIKSKYFDSNNKVLASAVGKTISMDEIMQMYVYIPRYKYQLFNAEDGTSVEQAINITFESKTTAKSTGTKNGEWLTHPAFTFGNTELPGFWAAKFEASGTTDNYTIKPNQKSLTSINLATMFSAAKSTTLNSTKYGLNSGAVDSHMMKNMEWGAIAFLTNSIYGRYNDASTCIASGCEVWINNINTGYGNGSAVDGQVKFGPSITGCAGSSTSAGVSSSQTACASGYDWTTKGVNASTTGNTYGIYDMSGGAWEYVMGVQKDSNGNVQVGSSGFSTASLPDSKYYDLYDYQAEDGVGYTRYHLGDATREVLKNTSSQGQNVWWGDYSYNIYSSEPWVGRGGNYRCGPWAGVFFFDRGGAGVSMVGSFRSVLSAG